LACKAALPFGCAQGFGVDILQFEADADCQRLFAFFEHAVGCGDKCAVRQRFKAGGAGITRPGFPRVFIYPTGYVPSKFHWKYYKILLYCHCLILS